MDVDWTKANCIGTDTEAFYPEKGCSIELIDHARRVCMRCDIVDGCAEHGIHHEAFGIWGGLTTKDRREIRRKRNIILDQHAVSEFKP